MFDHILNVNKLVCKLRAQIGYILAQQRYIIRIQFSNNGPVGSTRLNHGSSVAQSMLAQFTVLRIYADISSWGMIVLVCECRNDPMVIEFIVSCLEYPGTFKLLAKGISAS